MTRPERIVAALLLVWAALGLVHTGVSMTRQNGWAFHRSPAEERTIGLPDRERAPLVAGVLAALKRAEQPGSPVVVLLPASADSTDVIYTRYQLAHVGYPLRFAVVRDVEGVSLPEWAAPPAALVVVPEGRRPPFRLAPPREALREQ